MGKFRFRSRKLKAKAEEVIDKGNVEEDSAVDTENAILLTDGWDVRSEVGDSDPEENGGENHPEDMESGEQGDEGLDDCCDNEELDYLLDESDPELEIWEDKIGESQQGQSNQFVPEFDDLAGQPPEPKLPFKPSQRPRTIMVQNLPVDTTKQQLKGFFGSKFGGVEEIRLRTHEGYRIFSRYSVKDHPSIIAFIIFKKLATQKKAIKWKTPVVFRNTHVTVNNPVHPKSQKFSAYVTNLSPDTTDQDLLEAFQHCGKILSTEVQYLTGSKNYVGYVTFDHHLSLTKANLLKNVSIRGWLVTVQKCKEIIKMQKVARKMLKEKAKMEARQNAVPIDGYRMPFNADVPPINVDYNPAHLPKSLAAQKHHKFKGLNLAQVMNANPIRQKTWNRQNMTWVNPNLRKNN